MANIFGRLNLREKILLSLLAMGAVMEDLADSLYEPFDLYHRGKSPSLESYDFFREREKSARKALYYLTATKLISRFGQPGRETYQLTEEGLENLFKKFPKLKYGKREWDGYWRVVIYDIPEKDHKLRARLRSQLRYLGFRFLQKSVWVTPFAVEQELEQFLKQERLWGKIIVLKSKLPDSESQRWAKIFRVGVFKAGAASSYGVEARVTKLITDPLLPQGL